MLLPHFAWTPAHISRSQKPLATLYNIIMSLTQDFNMSTNDKLLWQIFMQFLQTQASVQAPQAPKINSKHTLNFEVLTG